MLHFLANLQMTPNHPIFPGRLLAWVLLMLSIASWVILLSKAIQLWRMKRANRNFVERLRKSDSVLGLYENDSEEDASLSGGIYRAGAAEAAFHRLSDGSNHRGVTKSPGTRQIECVSLAFHSGLHDAIRRLDVGIAILGMIAATALCFAVFGFLWTLMEGFDDLPQDGSASRVISPAIGFLVIGLLVAGPAYLGRLMLQNSIRNQTMDLERFCIDLQRLFERRFATLESGDSIATRSDTAMDEEEESDSGREYHSIRRRFQKDREEPDSSFVQINPIARQAAMGAEIGRR